MNTGNKNNLYSGFRLNKRRVDIVLGLIAFGIEFPIDRGKNGLKKNPPS